MKKFRQLPAIILAVILSLTLVFGVAACGETYTVTFESNGGSAVETQTVGKGKALTLPVPTKDGFKFSGWFESEDFEGEAVKSPVTVNADMKLYAKWITGNQGSVGKPEFTTGWEDEKVYTQRGYSTAIPSLWNELKSTDGGDRDIMDYLNSSFFEFDFKFDENGEIVPGEFEIVYSAATNLEDVTASYKGKFGIAEDDTVGHRAWRITIRDDLKWDDGTPIKASDFVYTMEKQLNGKYMFDQAANHWNGNYILHNSKNYFYSGKTGWYNAVDVYALEDYKTDLDSSLVFTLKSSEETKDLYGGAITYFRDYVNSLVRNGASYSGEVIANNLKMLTGMDVSKDEVMALEGKTLAQIKADTALNATWKKMIDDWQTEPGEELHFFVTNYSWPVVKFEDVGILAESDTQIVLIYDNANLAPIKEDGSLSYEAAYYFQSLPLVKKDLWEKLEVEPKAGSTLYDTNYNAVGVENSASWGPYKLTNYQAATTYTLSRNDKWYGYGMDVYKGQFQTDKVEVRQVPDWNTAWQAFQKGQFERVAIDTTIADEYRNSSRAYFTPTPGVSSYFLQCNAGSLTKERGNALLKYKDFRQAFSLALDRQAYCQRLTTSSQPSLGIYNDLIYYDVANGGVYRHDISAKEVLLKTYGAEKQSNGNWKVGTKEYSDIDDAMDALTGYNLNLAKEKFTKAYNEALAAGDIGATDKVTIRFGASEQSEVVTREINFLNEMFTEATKGTPLEGRVEIVYFEFNSATWIDDFRKNGMYDIANAYVSGGAWNPYYSLQIYVLDSQRLTLGWNTKSEMLEITVPAGGEGQPEIHDTLSIVDWFNCLNGLDGKYDISLYPTSSKLLVTAALEGAVLESYTSIPVYSITSSALISHRCEYITYEYNTFMAFGGIQYMTYKYDDTEWAAYVEQQGGTLDYKK